MRLNHECLLVPERYPEVDIVLMTADSNIVLYFGGVVFTVQDI